MADALIVTEQPTEQPVVKTPAPATAPAVAPAPLPGVPLAVAGANMLGLTAAGALSAGGPAGLAAVGAAAGAVALGGLARRTTRRRTGRRTTLGQTGSSTGRRTAGTTRSGGTPAVPGPRSSRGNSSTRTTRPTPGGLQAAARAADRRSSSSPSLGTGPVGRASGRTTAPGTPSSRKRSTAAAGGGKPTSAAGSAASGSRSSGPTRLLGSALRSAQQRRQASAPDRAARAADRAARRAARGVAKAERQAGVTPTRAPAAPLGSKAQRTALRRSALRHGVRMTGAAAAAGGVGLLSGLWNFRRPGVAYRHMRAVWARLSGRSRAAREARDAGIRGTAAPGQTPVPAETVNDPARATSPRPMAPAAPGRRPAPLTLGSRQTATAGGPMSGTDTPAFTRLSDAAEVMLQAASTFDPEVMAEFQALIDDLPNAMSTVQETLRVLAEISAERLPVHPSVVEEIGEGYRAMSRVVQELEEVGITYRRVHADDIERTENPRNGLEAERKWNV